jgi:hypothetical protein
MAGPVTPWTVAPFAPEAANLLCGLTAVNGGTIITIPTGRTWVGKVTLSATVLVASNGAAISANARVSTAGAGVTPPAGDYARLDIAAPASILSAIGTAGMGTNTTPLMVIAGSGAPATLVLNSTNVNTASASACGVLL